MPDKGKRRRGRRRGRHERRAQRPGQEQQPAAEAGQEEPLSVVEESEAPGILPFRLFFRRRAERKARPERERPAARVSVSPLSFWRRSRARAYRREPPAKHSWGRTWQRIRGFYFPPWVPVVAIIFIVFGILGFMFYAREATGAPRSGVHHWHATYQIWICGQRQPNVPEWSGGVHTHADGVIHIHPFLPSEEGAGARLVKWFEYGGQALGTGGKLTKDELQVPGQREVWKNGDRCPDGSTGIVQVFVNGERMKDWSRYIPQDGDRIRIVFGPEEEEVVQQDDRTIIPESEATRTVEMEVTDDGTEAGTRFSPATIELEAGETVKLVVKNSGTMSHGVRAAGPDGEYDTSDDYVSDPDILEPGEEGVLVVRFDEAGEYEFRDPTVADVTGTFVVSEAVEEEITQTFNILMGDNFFDPNRFEVRAGESFRLILPNAGQLVHNLRISGIDSAYDTADDLVSDPDVIKPGEEGELIGKITEPGVYPFRCDFHPIQMVGTIVVR